MPSGKVTPAGQISGNIKPFDNTCGGIIRSGESAGQISGNIKPSGSTCGEITRSGEPAKYLKEAEVNSDGTTLIITDKNNNIIEFTPPRSGLVAGEGIIIENDIIKADKNTVLFKEAISQITIDGGDVDKW